MLFGTSQAGSDSRQKDERVYGAGPSTEIVTLFFEHFSERPEAKGTKFLVPKRSTKHAGGIRASDQYLFGRTGRPLSKQEKAQSKFEIFLGRVPIGFATSPAVVLPPLTSEDIVRIFSGEVSNWRDLGGPDAPVVLLGRERTESVLTALTKHFPNLVDARYQQILKRDHAVVNFLNSPAGKHAIGFGAISNFSDLNVVRLRGKNFGINVGLVVDIKNLDDPLVKAAERFANSEEWRHLVESAGYFVAEDTSRCP